MTKLTEVEGIGATYAEKLVAAGCTTQEQLLTDCGKPAGRKALAEKSGISDKLILKWANRADLARIVQRGWGYLRDCSQLQVMSRPTENTTTGPPREDELEQAPEAQPKAAPIDVSVEEAISRRREAMGFG